MALDVDDRWQISHGYFDIVDSKPVLWPYHSAMEMHWLAHDRAKVQARFDNKNEDYWKRVFDLVPKPKSDKWLEAEDVKEKVDMVELLESYGLSITSRKRAIPCPFHNDKKPSMSVDYDKGLWHCFVGCGGGDSIKFVMKMESCDFMTALRRLNEMFV